MVQEAARLVIEPAGDDLDVFAPAACHVRLGLGVVAIDRDDAQTARRHFEHVFVHEGDSLAHTWCLINLGYLLGALGEHESALTVTQQGLEMAGRIGDVLGVTGAKCNQAALLRDAGRPVEALQAFRGLVPEMLAVRTPEWQAASVEDLACVLVDLGRYEPAGLLFHQADALRAPYTEGRVPAQERAIAESVARARDELGPHWDELRVQAGGLGLPAALEEALR
jgi:tetratricopeptide (TPR) repeat protein